MRKVRKALLLVLILILADALPVFAQDPATPEATESTAMTGPDKIEIKQAGLFPEGIEWDAAGSRFLVSSLSGQGINAVVDDGTLSPFADAENNLSIVGLQIDASNKRLLAVYSDVNVFSDTSVKGQAALGIYDLESADLIQFFDLASLFDGRHFANDVAVDAEGNAYVTDSFSPVIYKVTPDGQASIFAQDDRLGDPNMGMNGIDFDPDGFLLVTVDGSASLWKIPVQDPSIIMQVELSEPFGADGMILDPDGKLIAVATITGSDNAQHQEIISVTSKDGWQTATIDKRVETQGATTVTLRDGAAYAIYPQLDKLGSNPPPDTFEITKVNFGAG